VYIVGEVIDDNNNQNNQETTPMIYEKQHNGSYLFTAVIDGQLVKQVYYGYTLKDCKQQFRQYLEGLK